MLAGTLHTWIKRHIAVRQRLERMCTSYLLFLMVATRTHKRERAMDGNKGMAISV